MTRDAAIHPGAAEVCGDGTDQNCDGIDPLCPADIDDDGDRVTENQGDCNDADATIHPGAAEVCGDGIDQNCDGSDKLCPEDVDNDGDGLTENQGDCNDADCRNPPGCQLRYAVTAPIRTAMALIRSVLQILMMMETE